MTGLIDMEESDIAFFFFLDEKRGEKVRNSNSRLPSFWTHTIINLGPKRADRLHHRHHPWATIDCNVFPFQFFINVLAPSSQPHCGHLALHQQPHLQTRLMLSVHNTFIRGRKAEINRTSPRRAERVLSAKVTLSSTTKACNSIYI